jgi:hypothetical protein
VELHLHYLLTPAPDGGKWLAEYLRRLTLGERFGGAQCPLHKSLGVKKGAKFLGISIDHGLTYLKYGSVAGLKDGKIDNVLCGMAFDTEGNTITTTKQ